MRMVSVIDRELRAAARQSFTYALRVLGVLALLIVLGLFCLNGALGREIGERLFGALHATLFLGIWILAPLLTADCISQERREGTLPLLFLTNLSPRDIVYAKGFAHGLRAFTLWLAVLPLLAVPLVVGGVGWAELLVSALINFGALCLATAAGLAASAMTRVWSRSLALAACLAVLFFVGFLHALPFAMVALNGAGSTLRRAFWLRDQWYGLGMALNWDGLWQQWVGSAGRGAWPLVRSAGAVTLACIAFLLILIRFAAWRVRRVWREQPVSARVQWLKEKLVTPVFFQGVLRRWLLWQLRNNPIGWLEQRSWSGRLVVWSWFAIVICFYSSLFSNLSLYQRGFHEVQSIMASLLAGSIALSAAGSFRRERETGVLELLLVSPIREWQIIVGRVRGLWMQFLPAMVLLFSVWLYSATFLSDSNELLSVLVFANIFATLPVIGLYFSLTHGNFIASLVWTLLAGVALPAAIGRIAGFWFEPINGPAYAGGDSLATILLPAVLQILMAALLAWRLQQRLRYRRFALDRKG